MDSEVEQILNLIEAGHNFLLSGGAGSGKTYTLCQVINEILLRHPSAKIACMTYTNAAVKEIESRVNHVNLNVSTIHDFLWDNIKNFQTELKLTLIKLLNDEDSAIRLPNQEGEVPENYYLERSADFSIQYREYVRLSEGIISHDEVLKLAERMFSLYPKIISFVKSRYPYILIDEYQDTSPLMVKILLEHLANNNQKCIVGFFGDSMQSIYDDGVGDINAYLHTDENPNGIVYEVQKKLNRRCPQSVIDIANKLRTDGLCQEASLETAPNVDEQGHVKQGKAVFVYSDADMTDMLKQKLEGGYGWNFKDSKKNKELRLTHGLIAEEAGFKTLLDIHDNDKIIDYANKKVKKYAKAHECLDIVAEKSFGEALDYLKENFANAAKQIKPTAAQETFMTDNPELYSFALSLPFNSIACFVNKEQLLDDKFDEDDKHTTTGSNLSPLNKYLMRLENCIQLYLSKKYNDFMRHTSIGYIVRAKQKGELHEAIQRIVEESQIMTIGEVIELADEKNICKKDDKLEDYITRNPYLWKRIRGVTYQEYRNVYNYIVGNQPFSTQHKTKGSEYDNVLVVLKSKWNKYNFDSLFYNNEKPKTVVDRTRKLFYVCCTRAKENLVVYFPEASEEVVVRAKELFGATNVFEI